MSANSTKRMPEPLIIAAYVLTVIEIILSIFLLTCVSTFGEAAVLVVDITAKLLAILYFAKGFGKAENKYFRWYFMMLAASVILEDFFCIFIDYGMVTYKQAMIMILTEVLCYGNCFVIGMSKDLGKAKSVALMSISVLVHIYEVCAYAVTYISQPSGTNFISLIANISWLFGGIVGLLMVFAKYSDKAARGTK